MNAKIGSIHLCFFPAFLILLDLSFLFHLLCVFEATETLILRLFLVFVAFLQVVLLLQLILPFFSFRLHNILSLSDLGFVIQMFCFTLPSIDKKKG
jgi:hypothetical protein